MRLGNWIGGRPQSPLSGRYGAVYAPATGEVIGEAPLSDSPDVDAAYRAAKSAHRSWWELAPTGRVGMLHAFAAAVRREIEELALTDARDSGTPIRTMRVGASKGADYIDFFCGLWPEVKGHTIPATKPRNLHYTKRVPYGVVGIITPFNHPTMFALNKSAPALVAGNTVILKPSEQTPVSAARLAEISRNHLPPGVLNIVHGGAEAGRAIARHPGIWRIQLTGGVRSGLSVLREASDAGRVKKVTLELGGKNPLIVAADADPASAAEAAVRGMNFTRNQGQSCGSVSRLFVHRRIAKDVVSAVAAAVQRIEVGFPEREETEMGSLVSRDHQARVLRYVRHGKEEGARLVVGGEAPGGEFKNGAFVLPTVFDEVDPSMDIATQEIFGPVLSVIAWDQEADMLRAVNDVQYGLAAAVYTNDISTAMRFVDLIDSGYIWVNGVESRWMGVPFGGRKNSGMGSEHSLEELLSYTHTKAINMVVPE